MVQSTSNPFSIRIRPPALPVPSWVPPAGFFADVPMENFPQDLMPPMYAALGDTSIMNQPFNRWTGSAFLADFSSLGAQVYYGGGHEPTSGHPNAQLSLICDFTSLKWTVANLPLQPNLASTFVNGLAPDSTPYTPHTYLGLQECPTAWGGGEKGSLVTFLLPGSTADHKIHLLDVSKPVMGYSRLAIDQFPDEPGKLRFNANSAGGNYPITVMDKKAQGWWLAVNGSVTYTLFVHRSGKVTQVPALGGNLVNGALVLWPARDLLIAVNGGYTTNGRTGFRTLFIRNVKTNAVTTSLTLGAVPSLGAGYDGVADTMHRADVMGLQWVDDLGCIVGLDQSVSPPVIVKLTPPGDDPANAPWTWSTMSVSHWDQDSTGQATLQTATNGIWSKFRWIPTLQAFVYGTRRDRKPQVIKI